MRSHFFVVVVATALLHAAHAQSDGGQILSRRRRALKDDCRQATVDLYLVVDNSRLVGSNIKAVKTYLKTVFGSLRIAPDKTRFSLTTFGGTVTNVASLNDLTTRSKLNAAIDGITTGRRGAVVQNAMRFMLNESLFNESHGRNPDNEAICLIFIGSRINGDVEALVKEFQAKCRVVMLGAGYAIYRQISKLASAPSSKHIVISRYKDLGIRVNQLLKSICTQPIGAPRVEIFENTPNSVGLKWRLQAFASKYQAQLRWLSNSSVIQSFMNIPKTQDRVVFRGLTQATTYGALIWAIDRSNKLGPRRSILLTTSIKKPDLVVDETSVTTSTVNVTWDVNEGVTAKYAVRFQEVNNASNADTFTSWKGFLKATGLTAGTRYGATVSSIYSGIISDPSEPKFFTTVPDPPMLEVEQVRHISIELKWKRVKGARKFVFTITDLSTDATTTFDDVTGTSLKMSDLTPSKRYAIKAYTIGRTGLISRDSRVIVAFTAPSNPKNITLQYVTETTAQIEWPAQPAAIGYRVIARSPDRTFYRDRNISSTTFWVGGMASGETYVFSVYSRGAGEVIDYNVVHPLRVQTVPSPPDAVTVNKTGDTFFELHWNASVGAYIYHVYAEKLDKGVPTGNITMAVNNTELSALVGGLEPGMEYRMSLRTEGYQGELSKPSETFIDSTLASTPEKLRAAWVNMTMMTFELEPAAGAQSYIVEMMPLDSDDPDMMRRRTFRDVSDVRIEVLFPGTWYSIVAKSVNAFGKVNEVGSPPLAEQSVPAPPRVGSFWEVTSSSMLFRWPEVFGAISYNVYVSSNDFDENFTEPYHAHYHSNDTELHVFGLRPGTRYGFRAQSIGHSDRTSSLGEIGYERSIPVAPLNVREAGVTVSTIKLNWDRAKGATHYEVLVQTGLGHSLMLEVNRPVSITTELQAGTWYNFTVYSKDVKGRLNPNGTFPINLQTTPLPPANARVRNAETDAFLVLWDEMWGATAYLVQIDTDDETATVKQMQIRVNNTLRAQVRGLDPGTRYNFYLSSIGFQEQVSFVTPRVSDQTLPVTPERPILDGVTTTSIAMEWNDVKGAQHYVIKVVQFTPSNYSNWEVESVGSASTVYDLVPGAWYNMSVLSVGTRRRRNLVASPALTAQTVPLAPINIDITEITTSTMFLNWNFVVGAAYYVIAIREGSTSLPDIQTEDTSVRVEDLKSGTEYVFQVTSVGEDSKRKSKRSLPVTEETVPASPDQPSVLAATAQSVELNWNKIKGARRYIVTSLDPSGEVKSSEFTSNSGVVTDLVAGTQYTFRVYSVGKQSRRNADGSQELVVYTAPSPPENVRTTSVSTNHVELAWDETIGARSYLVEVKRGESTIKILPSATTQLQIDDLIPGTTYTFDVLAVGEQDRKGEETINYFESTIPDTPASAVVSAFTEDSISITWEAVRGTVVEYIVTFEQQGTGNVFTDRTTETSLVRDGLEPGTRYTIRLQTLGEGKKTSGLSEAVVQQTVTLPPGEFDYTAINTDSIDLSWNQAVGASSYEITVTSDTGDVTTLEVTGMTETVTSLLAGTRYNFAIRSIGDDRVKSIQDAQFSTATVPATPAGVEASGVFGNRVSLRWQAVKGAVRYRIAIASTDSYPKVDDVSQPEVTVRSLRRGAFYNFTVFSIGEEDRINAQGSQVLSIQTIPKEATQIKVDNITTSAIGFQWKRSYGTSHYAFRVTSPESDVTFQNEDGSTSDELQLTTTGKSLIVTSLRPGTSYVIRMKSVGIQEGRESDENVVITESTLPDSPPQPSVLETTTTSVRIGWKVVHGAVRYDITMESPELENQLTLSSDVSQVGATDLRPGVVYTFVVYSIGVKDARNNLGSLPLQVQTITSTPENVNADDVTTTSARISWDAVYGSSFYKVRVLRVDFGAEVEVDDVTVEGTSHQVTSLQPGTEYRFTVRSFGEEGVFSSGESAQVIRATLPNAVTSWDVDSVTTTEVTISWPQATGASRYRLTVLNVNDATTTSLETGLLTQTATGLRPGNYYEFRLTSIGDLDVTNADESLVVNIQTVPNPPSQIDVNEVTINSIRLSWRRINGAESYEVDVTLSTGDVIGIFNVPATSQAPSYKVTGLQPGTNYVIVLRTVGRDAKSAVSREIRDATRPARTSGVDVTDVTINSASLSWQPVTGAQKYQVYYRNNETTEEPRVVNTLAPEANVIGLDPGTWYEFVVFSVGIKDRRNERGSDKIQLQTIPLAPDGTVISDVTTLSMRFTWNGVKGAASYKVEYGTTENDVAVVIDTSSTTVEVTSLASGTEYWFLVKSVGQEGLISDASLEMRDQTVPSAPDTPTVTEVTTTSISLDWNDVKGTTRYDVRVTSNYEGEVVKELQSQSSNILISNLRPGVFYDVIVFSVGTSDRVNRQGSAIVTQQTVPSKPSSFRLSDVTTTSLNASWDEVYGAMSYHVSVATDGSDVNVLTSATTSLGIENLEAGTEYRLSVVALGHENLRSAPSDEIVESTLPNAPDSATITTSTDTAQIDWENQKGATAYKVVVTHGDAGVVMSDVTSPVSDVTIQGLQSGEFYRFEVFSVGTRDRVNMAESFTATRQTVPGIPQNFQVGDVTTNSIELSWDEVNGASGYRIERSRKEKNSDVPMSLIETADTSYVIDDVEPGITYSFTVKALARDALTSSGATAEMVEVQTVPLAPNSMSVTSVTSTSVGLQWNQVTGFTAYEVNVLKGGEMVRVERSSTNSVLVSGLTPGDLYDFSVVTIGEQERRSDVSAVLATQQTNPPAPENLKVDDVTKTSLQISWLESNGAVSYVINLSTDDSDVTVDQSSFTTSDLTFTINNLVPGTEYRVSVTAIGRDNLTGITSPEIRETTLPITPTDVKVTEITTTSVSLDWTATKGSTGYHIDVYVDQDLQRSETTQANTIDVSGLDSGVFYRFAVASIGSRGQIGESSDVAQQTRPAAPTSLSASSVGNTSFDVTWTSSVGASYYVVTFGDGVLVSKLTEPAHITDDVTVTLSDLESGTEYVVVVQPFGGDDLAGVTSQEIRETTLPSAPAEVNIDSVSTTEVALRWSAVKGAESYSVLTTDLSTISSTTEVVSVTSTNIENLMPGVWYNFAVTTVGVGGRRNEDDSTTVTAQTVPATPASLTVTEVTVSSISLSWNEVKGVKSYHLTVTSPDLDDDLEFVADTNAYTVTSLLPGVTYDIVVFSVGEQDQMNADGASVRETTLPSFPGAPRVVSVSTSSIELKWDDVRGAIGYVMVVRLENSDTVFDRVNTSSSDVTIGNLTPGQVYNFTLFSVGAFNRLNAKDNAFVAQQTVPRPPENFATTEVTSSLVALSWNQVYGASSYLVETSRAGDVTKSVVTSMTSFVADGLAPGIEYRFTVKANGGGNLTSGPSDTIVEQTVPLPPTLVEVTDVTTDSVDIKWTPATGARSYIVNVTIDNLNGVVQTINVDDETTTVLRLDAGLFYTFHVYSVGDKNRVVAANSANVTQQTVPASPENFKIDDITSTTISISWNSVTGAELYVVTLQELEGTDDVIRSTDNFDVMMTSFHVGELKSGTVYGVFVKAIGRDGLTSAKTHIVMEQTIPIAPSQLKVDNVATTSVEISWISAVGARSYLINATLGDSGVVVQSLETPSTGALVSRLEAGLFYNFLVYSIGDKERVNHTEFTMIRQQTVPSMPRQIQFHAFTSESLAVEWIDSAGAVQYIIEYRTIGLKDNVVYPELVSSETYVIASELMAGVTYGFTVKAVGHGGLTSTTSPMYQAQTIPKAPTSVTVDDVTINSVTLSWPTAVGARVYTINVVYQGTDDVATSQTAPTNVSTVLDLQSGVFYEFRVSSVGDQERTNLSDYATATQQTVTDQPSGIRVNDVTSTFVSLSWDDVIGATSYEITVDEIDQSGSSTEQTSFVTSQEAFVVTGLTPGMFYRFAVKAKHGSITSVASEAVQVQTIPAPPSSLTAAEITTDSVRLTWAPSKGATSYRLRVTLENSADVIRNVMTSDTFASFVNLDAGLVYDFFVVSVGEGRLVNDSYYTKVSHQTVPVPPDVINVDDVTTTSIALSWNDVTGASSYLVEWALQTGSDVVTGQLTTSQTASSIEGLESGVRYTFTVKTVGRVGIMSEPSRVIEEQTVPLAPDNLQVTSVTSLSISLRWTKAIGASSYRVDVTKGNSDAIMSTRTQTENVATFENLIPGEGYTFKVRSIGDEGRIDESLFAVLTQQTAPEVPENVVIDDVTTTSIGISWKRVNGAKSYVVKYKISRRSQYRDVTVNEPMIVIRSLTPDTEYDFTVRSVSRDGQLSDETTIFAERTKIGAPRIKPVTELSTSYIKLEWESVTGASSYVVQVFPDIAGASFRLPVLTNEQEVVGLIAGTRYRLRVASVDRKGRQSDTWSDEVSVVTAPLPPRNIRITRIEAASFALNWEGTKGSVRYDIIVRRGAAEVISRSVEENGLLVEGLEPGTLYTCLLKSVNTQGTESATAIVTQRTAPLPATDVVVSRIGANSLQFVWQTARGADSYVVELSRPSLPGAATRLVTVLSSSVTVDKLRSATEYEVTVTSLTVDDIRGRSTEALAVRTRTDAPQNLKAERINQTAIGLSWDTVRGAVTYSVYVTSVGGDKRKASAQAERKIANLERPSVVVGDLKAGVNYTFEVTARNLDGLESARSESVTQQTLTLKPVLPESLVPLVRVSNVTQVSIVANWPVIPNSVAYSLVLRWSGQLLERIARGEKNTRLRLSNLRPDTEYSVTLKAIGADGEQTEESSPALKVLTRPFPPQTPTGLRADQVRANNVVIRWLPAARALTYDVTVLDSDTGIVEHTRVEGTSYNITKLRHRGFYVISVTSVGRLERSRPSFSIRLETRHPSPVMPRNRLSPPLSIRSVTHDSFIVTLQPVEHAGSYDIILRSRREPTIRIGGVPQFPPTIVSDLAQNTLYDITYVAVGREGDKSRESDVVKTRTRRLVPAVPGDFQVLQITPHVVTVTWERALRSIGYQVRAQNTKTGTVVVFKNATPPYSILRLQHRNSYRLSVISLGQYFNSNPSSEVPVTIPYPNADDVSGVTISQIRSDGFMVDWTPTPFARSYNLIVSIGNRRIRTFTGLSTNEFRVFGLNPGTFFNVSVQAVSSDSVTLSHSDPVLIKTAPSAQFARTVTATSDPTGDILKSVVVALLKTFKDVPDSPQEGDDERQNRIGILGPEQVAFRSKVREHLEQMKSAVKATFSQTSGSPKKIADHRKKRQIVGGAAFESLISIAREIKVLQQQTRPVSNATVTSLSRRLSRSVSVLLTSPGDASALRDVTARQVEILLAPIFREELRAVIFQRDESIVVRVGNSLTNERILSTFAPSRSITSTGFQVMWVGYQNVHRFKLTVTKLQGDASVPVFEGLRGGKRVFISNLEPDTEYDVTIRPTTLRGDVIPDIVGKINVRTLPAEESSLRFNVTSLGFNYATVTVQKFPKGVSTLIIDIKELGSTKMLQTKLITSAHKRVTFTSLKADTTYIISAKPVTTGTGISAQRSVTTKKRVAVPATDIQSRIGSSTPLASLAPPTGLRVASSTRKSVVLSWQPVLVRNLSPIFIRYHIQFYRAGTNVLSRTVRLIRGNRVNVSRLVYPVYDVTVVSQNMINGRRSAPSPKLRVVLTNAASVGG